MKKESIIRDYAFRIQFWKPKEIAATLNLKLKPVLVHYSDQDMLSPYSASTL